MTDHALPSAAPSQEIALEHHTLDTGYFRITYPKNLSPESVEDLEHYLEGLLKRLARRVK
jgi:hypothetical protein